MLFKIILHLIFGKRNRGAIVTSLKKLDGKLIETYEELEDICYAYFQKLYDVAPIFDEALKLRDEILTSSLVKFTEDMKKVLLPHSLWMSCILLLEPWLMEKLLSMTI